MNVPTNPTLSCSHAACFAKELQGAGSEKAMKDAAKKHAHFLLGNDKTRMQQLYIERLTLLRHQK